MLLSRDLLEQQELPQEWKQPGAGLSHYPERILQFGTGVLLRALPDYFIQKALEQGLYKGKVVVVKSTSSDYRVFSEQDQLYTVWERGISNGQKTELFQINACISRVLSASSEWMQILSCATNPDLELVISNTTEVGLAYLEEPIGTGHAPESFPGKLLAILYERYRFFNGDRSRGLVIIPTELIPENGKLLKAIVQKLAAFNDLGDAFLQWLEQSCSFCDSMVDRIVTGYPAPEQLAAFEARSGYTDQLLTCCEPFRLWAIKGDETLRKRLGFAGVDEGLVVVEDLTPFIELKLRLLNGTHTFCCGMAFLSGITYTRDAVLDPVFGEFMKQLMFEEIIPGIPFPLPEQQKTDYALQVLERCRNPFVDHAWINITLQYSSKMKVRNLPLIRHFLETQERVPQRMACCFAAYLLFLNCTPAAGGKWTGSAGGQDYPVRDDHAARMHHYWSDPAAVVHAVLSDIAFWETDCSALPGFEAAVSHYMQWIQREGVLSVIRQAFGITGQ